MLAVTLLVLAGCAFDISHVKQSPATFSPPAGSPETFVLSQDVKAALGTGFPTRLKAGTRWRQVGDTEHGAVFGTQDQIVTVEASNTFEALLVVSNHCVTGFYLPVEKTFAATTRPIPIQTQPIEITPP